MRLKVSVRKFSESGMWQGVVRLPTLNGIHVSFLEATRAEVQAKIDRFLGAMHRQTKHYANKGK